MNRQHLEDKIIVAEIDALAADLSACFESMTAAARSNALRLGYSLSILRKHFSAGGKLKCGTTDVSHPTRIWRKPVVIAG